MTTERKIETIDVIKQMVADGQISQDVAEKYFPELKESEEDRIRKKVIDVLKLNVRGAETQMQANRGTDRTFEVYACNKVIAWLEKQGNIDSHVKLPTFIFDDILALQCCMKTATANEELYVQLKSLHDRVLDAYLLEKQGGQKPAEVESKFKVGNWYLCIKDFYGKGVRFDKGNTYHCGRDGCLQQFDYGANIFIVEELYEYFRPWTIQDARDGDVLYLQKDGKEHIIIYKGVIKERFRTFVSAYCAYNGIVDAFCFADVSRYVDIAYRGIMPATKEQRDILMKAMANAGYTFDFEKKELRKNLKE